MPTPMPILFLAHGSPMNAIAKNDFTHALNGISQKIPTPKAILMISAHWLTQGTWITHMQNPKTIHDFHGFPQELFDIQYPAPGDPALAEKIQRKIQTPQIHLDNSEWGLDHGTWGVLKHIYSNANIPVLQLSIDINEPSQFHYEMGKKIQNLRNENILILASGNIVHNLRTIKWDENATPTPWAIEFDEWTKKNIREKNFEPLINDFTKSEAGKLSVPTPDHYYPLLYILGASDTNDTIYFDYEGIQNASISMTSVRFSQE